MKTRNILVTLGLVFSLNITAQNSQHTVKQGETVYAISRKYGVSPTDILRLNPNLGNGDKIHPGQVIKLPAAGSATVAPATPSAPKPAATQTKPAANTPAATKPVATQPKPAATNTPVATKPAATAPAPTTTPPKAKEQPATQPTPPPVAQQKNEKPSYIIEVPKKSSAPAATPEKSSKYNNLSNPYKELYRIQKKDNLYRIALNYGMTVEEILAVNPGLTAKSKLKKGEFLYIPYSNAERKAEAERLAAEKAAAEAAKAAQMSTHSKHVSIAVILPLKDGGDRGSKMLEFYRGILMAADSIKHQGTSVDVYAYHSGSTIADINFVLQKPELKNVDFIFGPLDVIQASAVTDFCTQNNIKLVMPFSTTNSYGQNNPLVYQASISTETARKNAADIVGAHFTNYNYIILNTGNADDRGTRFTAELRNQITARGFTVKSLIMNADETTYKGAFNQFRNNLVIADASSLAATTALVNKLDAFRQAHPEFKISLLGYPEWPTYVSSLLSQFYALDTYAYTTFYRNPTDQRVKDFEYRFRQNYKKDLAHTFPRYGMYGFDLAYYFMNGLSKLGEYFDEMQSSIEYNPYQNSFSFDQANPNSAHINNKINLVHFKTNQRIEVIK